MSTLSLNHILIFTALLFSLGIYGLLTRRNLIAMLMAVELVLNAAALNFVAIHYFRGSGDPAGPVFALVIITVAAAEAAMVLSIVIALFRHRRHLDVQESDLLKH